MRVNIQTRATEANIQTASTNPLPGELLAGFVTHSCSLRCGWQVLIGSIHWNVGASPPSTSYSYRSSRGVENQAFLPFSRTQADARVGRGEGS